MLSGLNVVILPSDSTEVIKSVEEGQSLFKQFIREKPRAIALAFIILCSVLAVFAYLFSNDKTPNINEQIAGLSLKKPGFTIDLIKFPKNNKVDEVSWLKTIFAGREDNFRYVPAAWYSFKGDSLFYKVYDEDLPNDSLPTLSVHKISWLLGSEDVAQIVPKSDSYLVFMNDKSTREYSKIEVDDKLKGSYIDNRTYTLGTDLFGRSLLSRILLGIRFSLFIGLLAVVISITIGTLIGMISGFFGGKVDDVLSYIMNVFWSIPTLILVFAIVLVMGRGIQNIFIAVGLTMWVDAARLVRGQVLSVKKEKYVEAARAMGMSTFRILTRHVLPNMMGPLIVIAVSNFASAIIVESGLSYLGFGIQPPAPSLGSILSENYGFILSGKPMLAVAPVLVLLFLVLAFNLVGNGVRDIFDVKSNIQP